MQLKIEGAPCAVLPGSDWRVPRQNHRINAHGARPGRIAVEEKRRLVMPYVLSFVISRGHAIRTQPELALVTVSRQIARLRRNQQVSLGKYRRAQSQSEQNNEATLIV